MQIDRWFAISLSHLTLLLLCLGLSGVEYEEGEKSPTYADCKNLNRRYVCLTFVEKRKQILHAWTWATIRRWGGWGVIPGKPSCLVKQLFDSLVFFG